MHFGICCKPDQLAAVKAAGFDYAELALSAIVAMDDTAFVAFCQKMEQIGFRIEVTNGFFPSHIPLVGDNADLDRITAYTQKALARAKTLGVQIAVLGSGVARKTPQGFSPVVAREQFKRLLSLCGDIAAQHGIRIALEPLNAGETDLINTVAQGLELCHEVDHPQVGCLVDFYHAFMSGESLDAVETAGNRLIHAHIARPNRDRGVPAPEDMPTIHRWAQALRTCGYTARLSFEGRYGDSDLAAIRQMIAYFDEERTI